MPYKLTVLGRTFNTEDLTVGEVEKLEEELNVSWLMLNPILSVRHGRAIAATFLAREMGMETANEKVRAVSITEMADGVEKVPDSRPTMYEDGLPKAEAAQSTPGSSSASDGSGGPQT